MKWNRSFLALLTFALLGAVPLCAVQKDIEQGIVLMKTSNLRPTIFRGAFGTGQFDTGSDQILDAEIILRGEPLETAPGTPSLGGADTVIQLENGLDFPSGHPEHRSAYTRIRAMKLVSAVPLTVTYQGQNPELWDVQVCITNMAPVPPATGQGIMTFTNDCDTAGTFVSVLLVRAKFILKRQRDGRTVILDQDTIDPLGFISHGFWSNRSFSTTEFTEVPAGAVVDADCNGTFETTLPATADVILGLERTGCTATAPTQGVERISSVIHDLHYSLVLDPVTRDDTSHLRESALPPSDLRSVAGLGALMVLGVAAVVVRPRRKPGGEEG